MTDERIPRVIVFDLDGTLWNPEMYQLWGGGGSPFTADPKDSSTAIDKAGTKVRFIGETRELLQRLSTDPKWSSTTLAVSSTCDEPSWAMELLRLFQFTNVEGKKVPMLSLFDEYVEIYAANKANHHRTLLKKVCKKDPSIELSDFLFFDNQTNNIHNVSSIGVTSTYCPSGMVPGIFEKGIQQWREDHRKSTL